MNRKYLWIHVLLLVLYFIVTVCVCVAGSRIPLPVDDAGVEIFMHGFLYAVLIFLLFRLVAAALCVINRIAIHIREALAAVRAGADDYM